MGLHLQVALELELVERPKSVAIITCDSMESEAESKSDPPRRAAARGRLLTFAYRYVHHASWPELPTRDACAARIRSAFDRIGFHTSLNYVLTAAEVQQTVKSAAELLEAGDVLVVYFFGHGLARDDNQYLATEDGHVSAQCLRDIVSEVVADGNVPHVTFLLLLDCCRDSGENAKYNWLTESSAEPSSVDEYAITEAPNLGIAVSYSTCPGP